MGIIFTAQNLAGTVIRRLQGQFSGLGDTGRRVVDDLAKRTGIASEVITGALKKIGIGLAAAAAGFIALRTAFKLAAPAGELEQTLAAIGAVTRASVEDMRALEAAAIDAGVATQFSPREAAEGLLSLATAGQTATQATRTLIPVLDLAAGSLGKLGVAGAAEAVVGTLNSYQLSADKATEVTDKLLRITQLTNFQARDFATGLAKAAAAGSQFGQSLDDTLLTVGLLRNANIDASSASTAFREATRRLATDQRAINKLQGAGVSTVDKLTGKIRPLADVILELSRKTANQTEAQRAMLAGQIFGARGILAFNAVSKAQTTVLRNGREVVLKGADAIAELRKQMARASGTAEEFKNKLLDTFKGQKTLLKGTLETIAVAVGKPFAQVLKPVVRGVVNILNSLLAVFLAIPGSVKSLAAGSFVIAAMSAVVLGLVFAFKGLVLVLPIVKLLLAPLALPFLKIAAVIALVAGGVFLLKKAFESNFGGIRDAVMPVINSITLAFRSLVALFTKGEIGGALAKDLTQAGNVGVLGFVETISKAVARVRAFFRGAFRVASVVFKNIQRSFTPVFKNLGKIVGQLQKIFLKVFKAIGEALGLEGAEGGIDSMETLGAVITAIATGPVQVLIQAFAKVVEFVGNVVIAILRVADLIATVFGPVAKAVGGAFNLVLGIITLNTNTIFRAITSMANSVVDLLNLLISAGIKVASVLGASEKTLIRMSKLKIERFKVSEVAFALGASTETIRQLATGEVKRTPSGVVSPSSQAAPGITPRARRGVAPPRLPISARVTPTGELIRPPRVPAGTRVPGPTRKLGFAERFSFDAAGKFIGAPSKTTIRPAERRVPRLAGRLPRAAPSRVEQRGEPPITRRDIVDLIDSFDRRSEAQANRPIVLSGNVQLNGQTIAEIQAQEDRDSRARRGRLTRANRGR